MSYAVRTSTFEGPFDLLLHLILRQEVDIWDVSLSELVDGYIEVIERMDHVDLEVATEFLLIAATLVELKARRLLPGIASIELDEELLRFEERDLLLARLLECKTFQDAAKIVAQRLERGGRSVARRAGPEEPFRSLAPDPLGRTSLEAFTAAAGRALAPREDPVVSMHHVAPIRISVRDAVEVILLRLPDQGPITFRELVAGIDERLEVIVRFLACLELYKQGHVELEQIDNFGELVVSRCDDPPDPVLDSVSLDDWGEEPGSPETDDAETDDTETGAFALDAPLELSAEGADGEVRV